MTPHLPLRHEQLIDTLIAAFVDDPLYVWLHPDPVRRPSALRDNFELMLAAAHHRGEVRTDADGMAVALWTDPGVELLDDLQPFLDLLDRWAPERMDFALTGMAACQEHQPQAARALHLLAVHPDRQGRGLAAALIRPTLDRSTREGVDTYLESSNSRNLTFYERCGFAVTAEVAIPGHGPVMRPMLRPPLHADGFAGAGGQG